MVSNNGPRLADNSAMLRGRLGILEALEPAGAATFCAAAEAAVFFGRAAAFRAAAAVFAFARPGNARAWEDPSPEPGARTAN
eukprot:589330-Amphidinium_carterae.1